MAPVSARLPAHECSSYENVMVVGHNPNITAFLIQLLCGNHEVICSRQTARIRLRKGSIARLSLQRGPAVLQWLLDPRTVKALYATVDKEARAGRLLTEVNRLFSQ